jgi:hypothetical protein
MAPRYPRKFLAGSFLNNFPPKPLEPKPLTSDAPAKKRGRPFANGERKKTAAEIKRDQRRREKEEIAEINRERDEHIAKEDVAKRDLLERLRIAELNDNDEEAYDLREELRELLYPDHNYDSQTLLAKEREAKDANTTRVAVVDSEDLKKLGLNGKFAAKGLPSLNAGSFVSCAEHGKGKIIYGVRQDSNTGRFVNNLGHSVRLRDSSNQGRRVAPTGTNPSSFLKEDGNMRSQYDKKTRSIDRETPTPSPVDLSRWIHAKKPIRRKKGEVIAPVVTE